MQQLREQIANHQLDAIRVSIQAAEFSQDELDMCLYYACSYDQKDFAHELLETSNASPDAALGIACANGWLELVQKMIGMGADVNPASGLPLINACKHGHIDIVTELLQHPVNINVQDSSPIILATKGGFDDVVKYLIDHNAHLDGRGGQVRQFIAERGSPELQKLVTSAAS